MGVDLEEVPGGEDEADVGDAIDDAVIGDAEIAQRAAVEGVDPERAAGCLGDGGRKRGESLRMQIGLRRRRRRNKAPP